ncbi:FAD-dependent oxidoreductase [Candidatus Saccharibacteria bacterium]|nr:FAD-dependent oxidoreductase [Candidatus Saccharibacteria bacterium]
MQPVTFVRKQLIGPDIWEFFFAPAQPVDFLPGQYVHLSLPDVSDARGRERTLTLTSLPSDAELSFAVKFPDPHSAYKAHLLSLDAGDSAAISQAMGDLVLPRDTSRQLVFAAGGLGIASFVSIMKQLILEDSPRDITLLYGHKPDEGLYAEVTSKCPGLKIREFISPNRMVVGDVLSTDPHALYFVSGGESFTMGIRKQLIGAAVPATNIAYDYFDGYAAAEL